MNKETPTPDFAEQSWFSKNIKVFEEGAGAEGRAFYSGFLIEFKNWSDTINYPKERANANIGMGAFGRLLEAAKRLVVQKEHVGIKSDAFEDMSQLIVGHITMPLIISKKTHAEGAAFADYRANYLLDTAYTSLVKKEHQHKLIEHFVAALIVEKCDDPKGWLLGWIEERLSGEECLNVYINAQRTALIGANKSEDIYKQAPLRGGFLRGVKARVVMLREKTLLEDVVMGSGLDSASQLERKGQVEAGALVEKSKAQRQEADGQVQDSKLLASPNEVPQIEAVPEATKQRPRVRRI